MSNHTGDQNFSEILKNFPVGGRKLVFFASDQVYCMSKVQVYVLLPLILLCFPIILITLKISVFLMISACFTCFIGAQSKKTFLMNIIKKVFFIWSVTVSPFGNGAWADICRETVRGTAAKAPRKSFLSFEEAREKARSAKLAKAEAYFEWQKQHDDMPSNPHRYYKEEWTNWWDFLGNKGKITKKTALSYEEAVATVRSAKIKSAREYQQRRKHYPGLPSRPDIIYEEEWLFGWAHFFDRENAKPSRRKSFVNFEEAREKARTANLLSAEAYDKWQKQHDDIPSRPDIIYKEQWTNWWDFLGKENTRPSSENFLSFEEAREKARSAGLSSGQAYREWQKQHDDMPAYPEQIYAEDWGGWGDFLGTKRPRPATKQSALSFENAREKARKAKLPNRKAYKEWQRDQDDMPARPDLFYADQWRGLRDFLGTGFLSFEEAREKARTANLLSVEAYYKWQKQHDDMPSRPDITYKEQWTNWRDFLGTKFLAFEKAREKTRKAQLRSLKAYDEWHKSQDSMPARPDRVYADQWLGWMDFLETEFLLFEEARSKARQAGLLDPKAYINWQKRHPDMPPRPDEFYHEDWRGWRDFLMTYANFHIL